MGENKNDNILKKEKRIGTYTFGAMLIIIGICVIIMTFTKFNFMRYLLMLWPIILIGLGAEILYLNTKSDVKVKIDFVSIILMCIVLFFTAIFSVGNYAVNKILYDEDIKSILINEYTDTEYYNVFDNNISINAEDESKVNFEYEKKSNSEVKSSISIKYNYDVSKEKNISEIVGYKNKVLDNIRKTNNSEIIIKNLPEFVKSVDVTVYAADEDSVIYNGENIKK